MNENIPPLNWLLEPVEEKWLNYDVKVWKTENDIYRVYRIPSSGKTPTIHFSAQYLTEAGLWDIFNCERKEALKDSKNFDTLEETFLAVEKFHCKRNKLSSFASNREEVVNRAKELQLDKNQLPEKPKKKRRTPSPAPSLTKNTPETPLEPSVSPSVKGLDPYGYRLGSLKARLNAALGNEPKTMNELRKELGIQETKYNHLKEMTKKGYVQKVGNGYILTPLAVKLKEEQAVQSSPSPLSNEGNTNV